MTGPVEAEFLRPLYLGESVAPFRLLQPAVAVIPWDAGTKSLLNAEGAQRSGYPHLARWMGEAEEHWARHRHGAMSLVEQLDYYGKLSAQFPIAPVRLLYAASGTLPAATLLHDKAAIIEHALYWLAVSDLKEGHYLSAILNSEAAREQAAHLQARGQWGARHFDKVMFQLPIPAFNATHPVHQALSEAAAHAEEVAAGVPLREREYFVRTRGRIRDALREDGVAREVDHLLEELLGG